MTTFTAKSGRKYEWASVEMLRAFYKAHPGEAFRFWAPQDLDAETVEDIEEEPRDAFIPDGRLIVEVPNETTAYHDWLKGDMPGPYSVRLADESAYYLAGRLELADGRTIDAFKLQITRDPLNYLSLDLLDGIDVWVRTD